MTERRHLIAQRYLKGEMQAQIARALQVSQQQISLDLKVIHRWWRASAIRDFDAAQAQELAKIDLLEQTAWAAWERSLHPREITVTEETEGAEAYDRHGQPRPKGVTRKASLRKEGQVGDPRFLEQVHKCIERRCTLLGLNAPEKIAHTTPDGTQPYNPLADVPEDFCGHVASLLAQYGQVGGSALLAPTAGARPGAEA